MFPGISVTVSAHSEMEGRSPEVNLLSLFVMALGFNPESLAVLLFPPVPNNCSCPWWAMTDALRPH